MPRRLRFTNTKNYERKKQAKKRLAKKLQCHKTAANIKEICDGVLPSGWSNLSNNSSDEIQLCKLLCTSGTSSEPMKISHSIMINSDMTWNVYVHGNKVLCRRNTPLSQFPDRLSAESLQSLISIVDSASVCPGNPDEKFIRMVKAKKGVVKSANGEKTAAIDDAFQVSLNDEIYQQTIRTTNCSLLVHGTKCQACTDYRSHLRAMYSRWSRNKGEVS